MLKDEMLEAILRAILRKPERCPRRLVTAAVFYNERSSPESVPVHYAGEYLMARQDFMRELDRNRADLPAMLAD